ncbi:MAG: putative hydro-lyase [Porticoccaceae bacterium]|nr:putative hydro-lyase [Porticoccaceae bacterium]
MSVEISPAELRQKIRNGAHKGNTSGLCAGYVQCNLVILPADWAEDFLAFCEANPKPCPLIAVSQPGEFNLTKLGADIDIRSDIPSYRVFENGQLRNEVNDISDLWRDDLVAFLLGCSFSFEEALIADGLDVRNVTEAVNVPMYRTNIDCTAVGPFAGQMVVSMRPFAPPEALRAAEISGRFPSVHGEPVHYANPEHIGITDINQPDYGDSVTIKEGEHPLFWACGVTPQVALENAKPPFCITHSPGSMLVTDIKNSDLAVASE